MPEDRVEGAGKPQESEGGAGTHSPGIAGEFALFLARELDRVDGEVSPRIVGFVNESRQRLRLDREGLTELWGMLRFDVAALFYEYEKLLGDAGEVPPPAPPAGGLVSIRGAQSRPDLPKEDDATPSAPPPVQGDPFYEAGQFVHAGNYRCTECDAVVTQTEPAPLAPCDCGGRGWRRLG